MIPHFSRFTSLFRFSDTPTLQDLAKNIKHRKATNKEVKELTENGIELSSDQLDSFDEILQALNEQNAFPTSDISANHHLDEEIVSTRDLAPVLQIGDPRLRERSKPISDFSKVPEIVSILKASLKENNGIGLAGPQIGIFKQIVVVENTDPEDLFPFTVLINPKVSIVSDTPFSSWEGCLSVPGFRGLVTRPEKITVDYFDQFGQENSIQASGFHSTMLQHEIDHLNGQLYIDLIQDMKTDLMSDDEFSRQVTRRYEKWVSHMANGEPIETNSLEKRLWGDGDPLAWSYGHHSFAKS